MKVSVIHKITKINDEKERNHTEEVNVEGPIESNVLERFQALGNLCVVCLPFLLYLMSVKENSAPETSRAPTKLSHDVPVSEPSQEA